MAEIIDVDCSLCSFLDKGCCKACFKDKEFNVFENLTNNEIDLLMAKKQEVTFAPGETIIRQNTPSTFAVCVKNGIAKVYVEGLDGKKIIVKLLKKLDFVTGGDLFNGNIQTFTITAATPVTCCLIDSAKLSKLFSENNKFAIDLFRHHTNQNNYLLNKLVNITQKYMPGRVADTLIYLQNDIFNANPFNVPFTRQELAEMSNMTKESFIRILQEFKSSHIIKAEGNTIEIIDTNALISISKNG